MNLMLAESDSKKEFSDHDENDLNIISDSDTIDTDSELEVECVGSGICTGPCCTNIINIITSQKVFLLYIIDKIDDPEIKNEHLLKLKELIIEEKKIDIFQQIEPYKLIDIF